MNLDEKIESIDDIFTPFGSYILARQFLGEDGYFANSFEDFSDLSICHHGTLDLVGENNKNPSMYRIRETGVFYKYFLPSVCVQLDEEPKFRPFNLHEFLVQFPIGTVITYKHKDCGNSYTLTFVGYGENSEPEVICLGCAWYSLEELAEKYEYKDSSGAWLAFGVKEL